MRADAQANRQELLDAAWKLFSEHGLKVSLRTVAQEAQVGIATLYRHFPSREDLLRAVVEAVADRVRAITARWRGVWDEGPDQAWVGLAHELAGLGVGALAAQIASTVLESEALEDEVAAHRTLVFSEMADVLALAQEAGLVASDVQAPNFLVGLGAITRPLPPQADEMLPGQVTWLVGVYLRGLRPSPQGAEGH